VVVGGGVTCPYVLEDHDAKVKDNPRTARIVV
jgi:hypothetical protein